MGAGPRHANARCRQSTAIGGASFVGIRRVMADRLEPLLAGA
jgi:hypothetical protein